MFKAKHSHKCGHAAAAHLHLWIVKITQDLGSFLIKCLFLPCKLFPTKSRGGPLNEVWVMRLKGQSTSPSCLVWAPRAMGWVWWCYGIIFIELQHEDTLPVLPWIIQPPSALLENAVFFLGTRRKRELLFFQGERRRLNARCLFYMKRHLRCTFGGHRLVLRERLGFIFTTELSASALDTFSTATIQTLVYLHAVCHTHSQPLCQVCLPASSFYEHLRVWMHWLCKLKTTRKVDDENCQRSTKVARFASLSARCQVLKSPQWQHAHIQVFQCLSGDWSHLFPSFPQQSPETLKDINVTLQHNIILRSETSCGQVKLLEK